MNTYDLFYQPDKAGEFDDEWLESYEVGGLEGFREAWWTMHHYIHGKGRMQESRYKQKFLRGWREILESFEGIWEEMNKVRMI